MDGGAGEEDRLGYIGKPQKQMEWPQGTERQLQPLEDMEQHAKCDGGCRREQTKASRELVTLRLHLSRARY